MKKVILIPDSVKGTMSSAEICTVMAQAVQEYYPDAQVHSACLWQTAAKEVWIRFCRPWAGKRSPCL